MTYPPIYPYDPLEEIFPNVYLLHGSIRIGPGMTMNRNMVVFRQNDSLTLVNSVRVEERVLEPLGKVEHLLRLGDFHGLDDRYYQDSYGAKLWCQEGQTTYRVDPETTEKLAVDASLPVQSAKLFVFENARYPEAALLHQESGLLVTTDSLQNHIDWSYVSVLTRLFMFAAGLRNGLVIGPPWLRRATSSGGDLEPDFRRLLDLDFRHLIGAHGRLLKDDARQSLENVVRSVFR